MVQHNDLTGKVRLQKLGQKARCDDTDLHEVPQMSRQEGETVSLGGMEVSYPVGHIRAE